MLVAGVNIIEHMPRFCNWNSIMTAFDDVETDGLHKGFDSAVFKYNCLFACFMESCNKKEEYCLVIRVRQLLQKHHKWSCTCAKILLYVTYVGKYQEAVYQMS